MFRPDSDFVIGSGDSSSYHQDLPSVALFGPALSPQSRRQHRQVGGYGGPPMSTRQNKKPRKGRNNANNRERTVTTLTEDPNTPYLVPTPSEEPAGSHMPATFSGSAAGKIHNMTMGPPGYQMSGNFGFGYPTPFVPIPHTTMHQHQQQPYFSSPPPQPQQPHLQSQHQQGQDRQAKPALPPGKNDLEILQNLKKIIKDGQHPFYRAIPSPAALASLYKGIIPTQTQGRRSEASEYRNDSMDIQASPVPTSASGFASSMGENGRRQPRMQGKDRRPVPNGADGGQQTNNSSSQNTQGSRYGTAPGSNLISSLSLGGLKITKNSSGPPSAGLQAESRSSELTMLSAGYSAGSNGSPDISDSQHQGRYDYPARPRVQKNDSFPMVVDRPSHGDSGYDNMGPPGSADLPMGGEDSLYGGKDDLSRPGGWGPRGATHPSDDRDFDSERPTTPRAQNAGGLASVDARPVEGFDRGDGPPADGYDRDRDRPRRGDWQQHDRDRRSSYDRPRDIRLTDSRRPSVAEPRPFEAEFGHQPPVRSAPTEPPVPSDARRLSDARPPSAVDSHERPIHTPEIPPTVQEPDTIRPPGDSHSQPDTRADPRAAPSHPAERLGPDAEDIQSSRSSSVRPPDAPGALGSVPPAASGENLGPVDDTSTRPSLKERMNQPSSRQSRPPGEIPGMPGDHHPPSQDRFKKNKFHKGYHGGQYNGPPKGDRFGRHPMPADGAPPLSGGQGPQRSFRPRSPSIEGRKMPASPGSRPPRDYRGPPGRDMSRDRVGGYRPDFHDPRRAEGVNPDAPPPARYEGRQYGEFSPLPGSERNRPGAYTSSPPPMSGGRGPPGVDAPPARGDYYQQYPQGRRDWSTDDEDYYKSRGGWDRPPPSADRDRFERDYPPRSGSWDARQDRDFVARDGYPPGPPGPLDDRYTPGPPMPRDGDRAGRPAPGGYNLPYSRVRGRSPSPLGRAGPGPVDDTRPPMKRAREDFPPDYYPGGRPIRRPPGEYPPPRSGSQATSPSDWPPPASGSSTGTGGVGPPVDRDYRMGREPPLEYAPPASYDRPRSPGPPSRMPYNRGGYGRGGDRGGYGMRPPP